MEKTIFKNHGVRVKLKDAQAFLKIKETLQRIGIASKKDKTLYQSCHILHKQGEYSILHFKELFLLDNKDSNFSEEDKARRNTIVNLLEQWNLVDIIDTDLSQEIVSPLSNIKILTYNESKDWITVAKYTVGKPKIG